MNAKQNYARYWNNKNFFIKWKNENIPLQIVIHDITRQNITYSCEKSCLSED